MKWNSLLKFGVFKRNKNGKWLDPNTKKLVSRQTAFDRSAKKLGYKNYTKAKDAFKSKAYSRLLRFGKEAGVDTGEKFEKLFATAWNEKKSSKNKPLAQLLKYVQKINKYRSVYAGAL